jgi:thiosulfate/3-mercaptopyruvate sulfurtransferase
MDTKTDTTALVDTDWLDAHLDDPKVRVVEVDVNPVAFREGHIEGAVLWDIYTDLKDANYDLVDDVAVEQLVSRSGIGPDSTVVFYGYGPALGFWLMELYGHRDVRLLDASRDTWQAERRPWTTRAAAPAPTDYHLPSPDMTIRATRADVEHAIADPGCTILDVRTAAEYRGERFWPSGAMQEGGRAGHVPGATHLLAGDLCDPQGAFLPTDELAAAFAAVGSTGDHEIITYCTIGARASTTWFVLTHLLGNQRVRVYDGSWAEWGRRLATRVETGGSA